MKAATRTLAPATTWAPEMSPLLPPTTRSSTRMPMLWKPATKSRGTRTVRVRASWAE